MSVVHSVKSALELSRVEFSHSYTNSKKRAFSNMKQVENWAKENDVFVKLVPSKNSKGKSLVQVLRKGISHIAEIPEYAKANVTGDQVYINWIKEVGKMEVPSNAFSIANVVKHFCEKH